MNQNFIPRLDLTMAKRLQILIMLAVIIAGGAAWFYWQDLHPKPARTELTLYGNIDLRQVNLAFNDSGRIDTLPVQTGDVVHPGYVIATLDRRRFDAALALAQANLASSEAVLHRLLNGTRAEDIERLCALILSIKPEFMPATRLDSCDWGCRSRCTSHWMPSLSPTIIHPAAKRPNRPGHPQPRTKPTDHV